MNVVGIIAEYNPFHRGHDYQIRKLKEACSADYTVIAMSGNFVQRGAPALMDKYSRTRMALSCGADLVLELPSLFATASAEYFAKGGVSLLDAAGVVTHLGFGAETDNLRLLSELSAVLLEEPGAYREILCRELKAGSSFPAARSAALLDYIAGSPASLQPDEVKELLASPNNILALEYLQALESCHSAMIPLPILRQGRGYHDTAAEADFCSASAIRSRLKNTFDSDKTPYTEPASRFSTQNGSFPVPETAMPKSSYDILRNYPHPFLFEDDFSTLLHYELLTDDMNHLAAWGGGSPEIARRLLAEREHFTSWSSFCRHIKTKNLTYARLSRLFTHMLLHIRQEDYEKFSNPSYLRILGFRKTATPLLSALKSNSSLPLVTSPADAGRTLSSDAKQLFDLDLRAADLYRLCLTSKGDYNMKNDYKQQLIRL